MAPAAARAESIPRPEGIQSDVNFWIRVYTEVTTNEGFLHDERNLAVIYDTLKFGAGTSSRERQRMVDDRRERHIATLRRIAAALPTEAGREALSEEDKRVLAMWGPNVSVILLRDATQRIRFQLGQSDRFKEGLIRSSSWETHIAETFANQGLPPELAVLPHVESSFNAAAYSKVGAAGLWQFMRSTGRRYMRIDDAVDERLDPYRSTEAAAQLLAYNYRVLGSWPLALTAYNHGAAGMRRAKETVGTDDFVKINRTYNSRTFGFASRNFFPVIPGRADHRRKPGEVFRAAATASRDQKFREVADAGVRAADDAGAHARRGPRTAARAEPGLAPDYLPGHAPRAARLPPAAAGRHRGEMDRGNAGLRVCRPTSCTPGRSRRAPTGCARANR